MTAFRVTYLKNPLANQREDCCTTNKSELLIKSRDLLRNLSL